MMRLLVAALLLSGVLVSVPRMGWGASPSPALGPGDPTANVGGPYTVDEGAQITFSGDASDPQESSSTLVYKWDFEFDGSFDATASGTNLVAPTYTYADNSTFTVALLVEDGDANVSPISTVAVTGSQRASQHGRWVAVHRGRG